MFPNCWRECLSSGEVWMVPAAYSLQLLAPDISKLVRSSGLRRSLFCSYSAVAWGLTPLDMGRSEVAVTSSDTTGVSASSVSTPCFVTYVLSAAFMPHLFPKSWAVSLATVQTRPNPLCLCFPALSWAPPRSEKRQPDADGALVSLCTRLVSPLHLYPADLGQVLSFQVTEKGR